MNLTDIKYEVADNTAIITIDRADRLNAFRGRTIEELIWAFNKAWAEKDVGCVILTAAGDRAFCVGGDQKEFIETGSYGTSENGLWEIERLHNLVREIPKPVIAAVNGFSIGGGHVLHTLCDVTIAADHAQFGQVGPRVGSYDAGWGIAYLASIVGQKRAREVWMFCQRYTAAQAESWGLVNKVVPKEKLMEEAKSWAKTANSHSPFALRFLKASANAATANVSGLAMIADASLGLYVQTDEGWEGRKAFNEKRAPDFSKYRT